VLRLIGAPRVERDAQAVVFDNRKALALLAFLAVEGRAQMRDTLATMLWPEADRAHGRGALRRVLAGVKAALGPQWLTIEQEALAVRRGALGLWIDVEGLRRGIGVCRDHLHPQMKLCVQGRAALAEAVALYRGDFLAGFTLRDSPDFDRWQLQQSEALRFAVVRALDRLIRHHVAEGPWDEAVVYARRWLSLDPLSEVAHRYLMQLHTWSGDRGRALCQYQECVRTLKDELDAPPTLETVRLAEAIRNGRTSGCPPPRP
jgi:DNA-binding SARP family transcriptional activator